MNILLATYSSVESMDVLTSPSAAWTMSMSMMNWQQTA